MPKRISVWDGLSRQSLDQMFYDMSRKLDHASIAINEGEDGEITSFTEDFESANIEITPSAELIGIDDGVYRQINAALRADKRHILLYGPPGTGKTSLAQHIAGELADEYKLITGSADYSSQDILGGYQPIAGGMLQFFPGVMLEHFDKPFIFDELNRCDIDKVIGPLFTVLSGQSTTLPYLSDPADATSQRIEIAPNGVPNLPAVYAPGTRWRLIATINSIDKASLYQMSYALTRRFAWIYVDVPEDVHGFVRQFIDSDAAIHRKVPSDLEPLLGKLWTVINTIRPVGPAPFIDILRLILAQDAEFDFASPPSSDIAHFYLDGIFVFLVPMLDGIRHDQSESLATELTTMLMLNAVQEKKLRSRLESLAI